MYFNESDKWIGSNAKWIQTEAQTLENIIRMRNKCFSIGLEVRVWIWVGAGRVSGRVCEYTRSFMSILKHVCTDSAAKSTRTSLQIICEWPKYRTLCSTTDLPGETYRIITKKTNKTAADRASTFAPPSYYEISQFIDVNSV